VAGRIPGLSEVKADGFRTYTRPEGKSGGHGVGWSEVRAPVACTQRQRGGEADGPVAAARAQIPRYSFDVPDGWEETPVSIADLGGTEIDVRFEGKGEGQVRARLGRSFVFYQDGRGAVRRP